MLKKAMCVAVLLALHPAGASAGSKTSVFDGIRPLFPQSMEKFVATKEWREIEPVAWKLATAAGMSGEERQLWMGILWNESRAKKNVRGDHSCAIGLMQLHVGGVDEKGKKCVDNRKVLRPEYRDLDQEAFFDVETNLNASIDLFRWHGSKGNLRQAMARYAGCKTKTCTDNILGLHLYWRNTGLLARLTALEEKT